jgi:ABC-2 type transport system ATP-binding protein
MSESNVVEAAGLEKRYGTVPALDGLSLRVPAGSIFGLLGRNGAGKTTSIKVLMGMVRPTAGNVSVFGLAPHEPAAGIEIRRRVGFVDESRDLYERLTAEQIIGVIARFYPRWRNDLAARYLRQFAIPSNRVIKQLSRGTRTKLSVLLALCRCPDLVILDEATSGLDPDAAEEVLQALVSYAGQDGGTVLFSSHQLTEVEQVADHIAIIDEGRTKVAGSLDELRESYRSIEFVFDNEAPKPDLSSPGVVRIKSAGRAMVVLASSNAEQIIDEVRGMRPVSIDLRPVSIKELFLESIVKGN